MGKVEFEDVSLRYAGTGKPALSEMSMEVTAQSCVALVGNKGCGKSSVANLLTSLYQPDSGTIRLDGLPITKFSLQRLRSQIYHLTQDPVILNTSIADNIALGCSQVSPEQLYRAAFLAEAISFIESPPESEDSDALQALISKDLQATLESISPLFSDQKNLDLLTA